MTFIRCEHSEENIVDVWLLRNNGHILVSINIRNTWIIQISIFLQLLQVNWKRMKGFSSEKFHRCNLLLLHLWTILQIKNIFKSEYKTFGMKVCISKQTQMRDLSGRRQRCDRNSPVRRSHCAEEFPQSRELQWAARSDASPRKHCLGSKNRWILTKVFLVTES